jgi:NADPH-dependent curcumin reductase CurA
VSQRIEGFMCERWLSGRKGSFLTDMARWLSEGKINVRETFVDGIDNWPVAFHGLFVGSNVGKTVVRVSAD